MRFLKPRRSVSRVFLHCSASDNPKHDNVATMDRWHKQRGWSGVGYHFFIRKNSTVEIGRDIEKTPAAQGGNNRETIAICLHGLVEGKFTEAQFDALRDLCHQINEAYLSNVSFHGHCEVSPKTCPVFDYKKVLGLSLTGMLTDNSGWKKRGEKAEVLTVDEFHQGQPNTGSTVLRVGDKGMAVELLQRRLNGLGYHVGKIDGHFGKRSRAAVLAFQADNHLVTDAVVGRATYEAFTDAEAREIGDKRSNAHIVSLANDGSRITDEADVLIFASEFGEAGFEDTASLFRNLRDWMIDKFSLEEADNVLPSYRIEWLDDREIVEKQSQFSNPEHKKKGPVVPKIDDNSSAAFAAREDEIVAREKVLNERESKALNVGNVAFAESLVVGGQLLPAKKDGLVALLNALPGDVEVAFADGDKKEPLLDVFKTFLSDQPKIIDYTKVDVPGEQSTSAAFASDGAEVDPDQLAIHHKALAFQAQNKGTEYMDAIKAVS